MRGTKTKRKERSRLTYSQERTDAARCGPLSARSTSLGERAYPFGWLPVVEVQEPRLHMPEIRFRVGEVVEQVRANHL
jgi:DNA primase